MQVAREGEGVILGFYLSDEKAWRKVGAIKLQPDSSLISRDGSIELNRIESNIENIVESS